MTLVVFLVALVGGILVGLPICFALMFSGVCMMLFLNGFNSQILSQNLFSGADSFSMMAVPFFVLTGELMKRGGITKRIVNFANAVVGHVRGGLGYVSILAILLFASIMGSAVASTAALGAILIPMLPLLILVGLRSGQFTATEAGVICVAYALIVGIFIYRELKVTMLMDCLVSAAKSSSVIMFLAAAAMVSSWMMTVANIPATVTALLAPFLGSQVLLMLVICLLVLLVGTSMDVTPTIMILTPVLLPAIKTAGIDPAYFGVVFIIVTVMGLLTPPVGTVLNVACGAGRINMERIVKAIWPFLIAEVAIILLMVLFPQIVIAPMNFFSGG